MCGVWGCLHFKMILNGVVHLIKMLNMVLLFVNSKVLGIPPSHQIVWHLLSSTRVNISSLCSIAKPRICVSSEHLLFYLRVPCTWPFNLPCFDYCFDGFFPLQIVIGKNICLPDFQLWIMLMSHLVTDTLVHLVCKTTGILCDVLLLLKLCC